MFSPDRGQIHISANAGEKHWTFVIRDQGPGIPAESMDQLFEKFYRVPGSEKIASGTGLGLSICEKIVAAQGSQISVKSDPGAGAEFSFSLPYQQNST